MKIALCFSGQIRTGAYTAPNILRYIGKLLPQCDIFVHTWDAESKGTGFANRLGVNSLTEDIHESSITPDKKRIAEFYSAFMPRVMEVEEYHLQETKKIWGGRRFDPVTQQWYVSMWRSLYEANKLKMNYAQKNQITYDYTVRIRPDIVFHESKSLEEDISLIAHNNMFVFGDHYNIWPIHQMGRVEDIFWVGPTRVMDQISNYYACYTNTVKNIDNPHEPGYEDWQWHSATWIREQLGIKFHALRNNQMRILYEMDIEAKVDPLNPGFGTAPLYGKFEK